MYRVKRFLELIPINKQICGSQEGHALGLSLTLVEVGLGLRRKVGRSYYSKSRDPVSKYE